MTPTLFERAADGAALPIVAPLRDRAILALQRYVAGLAGEDRRFALSRLVSEAQAELRRMDLAEDEARERPPSGDELDRMRRHPAYAAGWGRGVGGSEGAPVAAAPDDDEAREAYRWGLSLGRESIDPRRAPTHPYVPLPPHAPGPDLRAGDWARHARTGDVFRLVCSPWQALDGRWRVASRRWRDGDGQGLAGVWKRDAGELARCDEPEGFAAWLAGTKAAKAEVKANYILRPEESNR